MPTDPREQLAVFLRDVKDNPDDDAPRMALADWLQDQGDPRGELLAIDLRRGQTPAGDPLQEELSRRERALLRDHSFTWLGPLADVCSCWTFRRGFIHIEARAEKILAPEVEESARVGAFDWVQSLRLTEAVTQHVARLARSPILDGVTRLDLSQLHLTDRAVQRLLESPKLSGLRVLNLAANRFTPHVVEMLAECPRLTRLRLLDLSNNGLYLFDGAIRLAESPHLGQLWSIDVRGNQVSSEAVLALCQRFVEVFHGPSPVILALPRSG